MSQLRERLSTALVEGAFERTLDGQQLERKIQAHVDEPGYPSAMRVVKAARRHDALMLWLGLRLRRRVV